MPAPVIQAPLALDPLALPNGGASLFAHADLDTLALSARLAKPLNAALSLYAQGDAGYSRLGGFGWRPFAQATAGARWRF